MSEQNEYPPRAVRPSHVESDPRTDGVGDGGERDLEPLPEHEVRAGVEHDRDHARKLGEL